jgi:hypothetical protein
MSADEIKPEQPSDVPVPPDKARRSGEGAATALQALIRKRKQVEGHDDPAPPENRAPLP